jgi:hypothetical protein
LPTGGDLAKNVSSAEVLGRGKSFQNCSVEIISLTPRFNAVNHKRTKEKPFKRFFLFAHLSHPAEAGC